MSVRQFALLNQGLDEGLGFLARTIRIDNPTPCYWFIPGADQWIVPFQYGKTLILPSPTERAQIQFRAPLNVPQPTPTSGVVSPALFTFYADSITPNEGLNSPAAGGRAPVVVNVPNNGANANIILAVPAIDGIDILVDAFNFAAVPGTRRLDVTYQIPPALISHTTRFLMAIPSLGAQVVLGIPRFTLDGFYPVGTILFFAWNAGDAADVITLTVSY